MLIYAQSQEQTKDILWNAGIYCWSLKKDQK